MMTAPYKISQTMISEWDRCRESFRRRYVEQQVPLKPAIHMEFGTAIHAGIDSFWKGLGYDAAFSAANNHLDTIDLSLLPVKEKEKWFEMWDYMPELLAAYFRHMNPEQIQFVANSEHKWEIKWSENVVLTGRIDRIMKQASTKLVDAKTRTVMGREWKQQAHDEYCRDFQFGMYDYYCCQAGLTPDEIQVEVLVKPGRDKICRIEVIDLSAEIIAGRDRFKQQLLWKLTEIEHYLDNYQSASPWPMAGSQTCMGKYSNCDYLECCLYGDNARTGKKFKEPINVAKPKDI